MNMIITKSTNALIETYKFSKKYLRLAAEVAVVTI